MTDLALLILRLGLGVIFVAHGAQVAFGAFGGPGIKVFSEMLSGMGFKPALSWAYIAAYIELIGGLALIFGIYTRVAAVLILVFMLVAVFKVHWTKGFFIQAGGYEYNFLIVCVCITLLICGPGKYSLFNKF